MNKAQARRACLKVAKYVDKTPLYDRCSGLCLATMRAYGMSFADSETLSYAAPASILRDEFGVQVNAHAEYIAS